MANSTIKLEDVIHDEFLDLVGNYVKQVNRILEEYDCVIFMARKAICFYKSLHINGEITGTDCYVVSSRVLTYDCSELQGKRIAIIDDVVVKGESLKKTMATLLSCGLTADIYFIACESKFVKPGKKDEHFYVPYIKTGYVVVSQDNILKLSSYITDYINVSLCPYNIDYPTFQVMTDANSLHAFQQSNRLFDITSATQRNFGIYNCTINYEGYFPNLFYDSFPADSVFPLKIRVYSRGGDELLFMPIILFPWLSKESIDKAFAALVNDFPQLEKAVIANPMDVDKQMITCNKLRILQYVTSYQAFSEIVKGGKLQLPHITSPQHIDSELRYILPEKYLGEFIKALSCDAIIGGVSSDSLIQVFPNTDSMTFDDYFSLSISTITKILKHRNERIFTFFDVADSVISSTGTVDYASLSNVLDILIDMGICIPFVAGNSDNSQFIRGYKTGEIAELTEKNFRLFAYMLNMYSTGIGSDEKLYRTEFEKLCVIFFRRAARTGIFKQVPKNYPDRFTVGYTKFGPRVSETKSRYRVDNHTTLLSILTGYSYVYDRRAENTKGKLLVTKMAPPSNEDNKDFADSFAYKFSLMQQIINQNSVQTEHVKTYIELLTILSIGKNRIDRLLSLIAELYLFSKIDTTSTLQVFFKELSWKMDGVESGLWKYLCFSHDEDVIEEFKQEIYRYTRKSEKLHIKEAFSFANNPDFDTHKVFGERIDKCGELIYKICKLYAVHADKYVSTPAKHQLSSRNHIKQYENATQMAYIPPTNEYELTAEIIDLQIQAETFIKIYELYEERTEVRYTSEGNFLVLPNNSIASAPMPENSFFLQDAVAKNQDVVLPLKSSEPSSVLETINQIKPNSCTNDIYYWFEMNEWYKGVQRADPQNGQKPHPKVGFGSFPNSIMEKYPKEKYKEALSEGDVLLYCTDHTKPILDAAMGRENYPIQIDQHTEIHGQNVYVFYCGEGNVPNISNNNIAISNPTFEGNTVIGGNQAITYQQLFSDLQKISTMLNEDDKQIVEDAIHESKQGKWESAKKILTPIGKTLIDVGTKVGTHFLTEWLKGNL